MSRKAGGVIAGEAGGEVAGIESSGVAEEAIPGLRW